MYSTSEVKRSCGEMYFDLGLLFLKRTGWVSPHTTEIQRYYYYDKNNDCLHVRL